MLKRTSLWLAVLCLLPAMLIAQDSTVVDPAPYEGPLAELIALLSTTVTSLVLGFLKKYTNVMDGKWRSLIKPFQPIIVALFGSLIPMVVQWVGLDLGDPDLWVNGAFSALIVVAIRELKEWVKNNLATP